VSKALGLAGATYGVAGLALAFLHIADWPGVSAVVIVASAVFAVVAYRLIDPTLRQTIQTLRRGGRHEVLGHAA
jgi:membrane protein implicated in regulation of membrane protease activity